MKTRNPASLSAYVVVFSVLVWLVALKPDIDNSFHAEYQSNLEHLESLSVALEREQRNVRLGITRHYDYLEATLQEMEKAAELVGFAPAFVDDEYRNSAAAAMGVYRQVLEQLRREIDTTKRLTGLLRNSTVAIETLLNDAAESTLDGGSVDAALFAMYSGLGKLKAAEEVDSYFDLEALPEGSLKDNLRPHVGVAERLGPLSAISTRSLQRMLDDATQPTEVRQAYLDQYYAAVRTTQQSLVGSYIAAGMLLLLSMLEIYRAKQARNLSDRARVEAEAAHQESEQSRQLALVAQRESEVAREQAEMMAGTIARQLDETRAVVDQCNEVLEQIAHGMFGRRVELELEGDLGKLCSGVNMAARRVEETIGEIDSVMVAIGDGRLDVQVSDRIEGKIQYSVKEAMRFLKETFSGIQQAIEKMARGQFSARVEVEAKGDLARLKNAINLSMSELQAAIGSINDVVVAQADGVLVKRIDDRFHGDLGVLADAINRSSGILCKSMNEATQMASLVSQAAEQVNAGAGNVNQAAQEQIEALRTTLEGNAAVSEGIERNAKALQQAGMLAEEARLRANQGEQVVNKAQKSMVSIIDSSKKIGDIVGMIESIAFKTNLLALNAAVEAARANEHGRGFAVVAQEVRSLAQQTADASMSIKKLIQHSVEEVQRGAVDVEATGKAFESISDMVARVNTIFVSMDEISRDQKASMLTVAEQVQELEQLSFQNLALAEANEETAEELTTSARRMNEVLSHFESSETSKPGKIAEVRRPQPRLVRSA